MGKRISLLAIDDDPHFLELITYPLEVAGFKVYTACNGRAGIKLARKKDISVILLDTVMPEMDGLQTLSELKHHKKTEDIPVIMLTAKSAMGDLDYAFKAGADDYITKPVEIRDLADKIKSKLMKLNSVCW